MAKYPDTNPKRPEPRRWRYPLWLNLLSLISLILVPTGLLLVLFGCEFYGHVTVSVGFIGIMVCGVAVGGYEEHG